MRPSATNSPGSLPLPESCNGSPLPGHPGAGPFLDEACLSDMDNFVRMLGEVRARGTRPDLVGSVISHCATRWLPELAGCEAIGVCATPGSGGGAEAKTEGSMAAWMKKRFFVETLVGVLPLEKDALPCGFLLRLLRVANMVGAEPAQRAELEARVARQLEQASLRELMIPAFSHTCGTLLDVGLTLRLVKGFAGMDEAVKSGAAMVKVAKVVDGYLAEAAVDANLSLPEFVALAGALPGHSRSTDDGLYRAVDTYLKVSIPPHSPFHLALLHVDYVGWEYIHWFFTTRL
ncbi:hypothetical protein Taro_040786 [Colocasia esculenta]|uniref:NPH3 domain-containing protein n=1 Tax=Colocasia esculenta TaxID=4460 RepID=A0A843W9U5_COLES|nr:hypothetical protein [Colocasia esculenta]